MFYKMVDYWTVIHSRQIKNFPADLIGYINLDYAYEAEANINKIIDGDTVEADIAGFGQKIRLIGIDCPEGQLSNDFDKVAKMYAELEKGIKDMGLDIRNYPDLQNAALFFRQKTVVGQLQKDIEKLFK